MGGQGPSLDPLPGTLLAVGAAGLALALLGWRVGGRGGFLLASAGPVIVAAGAILLFAVTTRPGER